MTADDTRDCSSERGAWRALVEKTVARIREIESGGPLTRDMLQRIRAELLTLSKHPECFSDEEFPPPEDGQGDRLYCLSLDDGDRRALYLNKGGANKNTPPHDHTTWAVVIGIVGEEHNRFYEREDDGREPGRARLRVAGEFTVEPGTGVCLMPDDIHSIHMDGPDIKTMIHMYGRSLPSLTERVQYDLATGEFRVFPAHPNITMMA
ncbi:cysteine dioxygenase [Pelagibius sp. CAU 1746]|uniref:cysteine dioxygenase family protein n=1 Tax=Pelagibius sp. CAU 1746 TaxID=3140370 RepID=UPI00325B83B2